MFIFCADFRTIGSRPASTQTATRSLAKSTIGTVPNMKKTRKIRQNGPLCIMYLLIVRYGVNALVRGEAVYSKNEVINEDLQYSVFLLDILCSPAFSLEPPETE